MARPFQNHAKYPTREERSEKREALRRKLFKRQGGLCWICGRPMQIARMSLKSTKHFATFDHVRPQAHGGTAYYTNLRLAHGRCNSARGSPESES